MLSNLQIDLVLVTVHFGAIWFQHQSGSFSCNFITNSLLCRIRKNYHGKTHPDLVIHPSTYVVLNVPTNYALVRIDNNFPHHSLVMAQYLKERVVTTS